ncbi:MAG: amino acid adenylation domain-containing protein [Planctomycetes bacterium]|nr:amino acid adenylation domain-containing protein [Planctomycetota bacterium]
MKISLYFQDLIKRGAKLWIEEEQLRCQGPGEVLTPEVLETLKQHKSEFLDLLRKSASKPEEYPLSHGQQALWFLNQDAKESAAYNTAASLRICSPLNVAAMKCAFQYLVDRHPLLRAFFPVQDGKPLQRIRENQNVLFEIIDAADRSEEQLKQQVIQAYQNPFDLETGPLFRIHLFRRTEEDHLLLITVHHIVFDAWSGWLLMDEFSKLYSSITASQAPNLKPLQHSYLDYIQWQTEMLSGPEGEKLWQYWQKKLAGEIPVLQLPTDRPRPPVQTFHGSTIGFPIDDTLTRQLRELAREEGTTLFTVLMAAFHVLLYRYTGQDDVLVGSPTGGRDNRDFTGISGYFVNPVVIRTDCAGSPTFRSFLHQVCDTVLEAIDHQDFPFQLIVERLQPKRSSAFSPLFQVDFVLQKAQVGDFTNLFDVKGKTEVTMNWGGLEVKPFVIPQQEGQFDVTLEIIELENSLSGHFKYNTDLFNEETIKRMAGHFEVLLRGIVQNPAQQITALPLFMLSEQQQLQVWNQTETVYPKDKTIVDLFQEQVEKMPDNIAVVFEDQQLTYWELNRKANQLAHYLLNLKTETDNSCLITDNCLVGICVERSLEMVIGLLGVLKAGGAYVPLDPEYPKHRLQFMLEDSQVSVLLTQRHLRDKIPAHNAQMVCLDNEEEVIGMYGTENPARQSNPEQLVYVIYTSGSTGKPKGVMVENCALANFLFSMQKRVGLTQKDKLLAITTLSFDIAALELYLPVITGAQMILISRDTASDGKTLSEKLSETQTTIMQATPATWKLLIESTWNQRTPLTILCGGEALPVQVGQTLQENSRQLWNVYGPTETTIWSSAHNVTKQPEKPERIGKPIANTQIYILDTYHNTTPIGIPGELCIAGFGLARGYLNRPDLTAEKFIEVDVFGKSERLYKTGDRARWLSDGNLEYLGRLDHQIKLRGFRIELGEIEATLSQHEAVQEAVVVFHENEDDKRLVAFVSTINIKETSHSTLQITNSSLVIELRTWLKAQLPEYMIPASFMVLDKMPLTPNGKIDRKKLQELDTEYHRPDESYVAPRTPEEELLSVIWANLLRVERVGIHDSFFELGGHSLIATQLVSRIRESFEVEMPLRIIFDHPILQDQAAWLNTRQRQRELPPIVPLTEGDPQVLSFAQQRLWFLEKLEGQSATYNIPAALRLEGELDYAALERSMETLIKRHDCLRLCFPEVDGQATLKILDVYNPLTFTDLSVFSDAEQHCRVDELIESHPQAPFDITTGPLLRLHLVKISDEEHILLFNMHHIISDGWSIGVLIREWSALYSAYYRGQEAELPELSIQYTDYAAWQRNWLSGEVLERQLSYWQEKLANAPELSELPTDYPRPASISYHGIHLQSTISVELTERLKRLSKDQGVTLYMTLLTAFNALLYRYSGKEDILVGSPIANRTHHQTEDLIGLFVNTLVLRTRFQSGHSITELLKQVRQTALEAYAHQDIPFEYLIEQINPTRSLSHSPLFQVMFVMQNAPIEELDLADIKVSFLEQENIKTKFDLTLSIEDRGDELVCDWEYCTDLFRQETIERMMDHFQILLEGIINNPAECISQLPLLTETETQQLQDWNQTEIDYPKDKTIIDLFQEQVEKTPDNIAVVFEDQQLTYQELNRKANQLAHYLQTMGVGPEVLVGVCMERSVEMIIAILGVLKAGGGYVPLDPSYPKERLSFMATDSGALLLLTQKMCNSLKNDAGYRVINIDTNWPLISQELETNLVSNTQPDNVAYVIYTSGSTGRPKGVIVEHRNINNLLNGLKESIYNRYNNRLKIALNASYVFDASVQQIFGALLQGHSLYIIPEEVRYDGQQLINFFKENKIDISDGTPTHLRLIQEGIDHNISGLDLKHLIIGGEALPQNRVKGFLNKCSLDNLEITNVYGPTECCVDATFYDVRGAVIDDFNIIPIGRPLAGTKVYILDRENNVQPIGVAGELCISGDGVARGYLNREELTSERFVPNPFLEDERMYRTGDIARVASNGELEFIGRTDYQVKFRGYRIELGEIEAVLAEHSGVKESVVVVRGNSSGEAQLAAYIVATSNHLNCTSDELRDFIKEKLPGYMAPSYFVMMEELPLTISGKVDRLSLLEPERVAPGKSSVGPRNTIEEIVTGIWAEVLELDRVGVYDNFFELGGHSLMATRVISRIRSTFSIELPLRHIFESSTIAGLSEKIETKRLDHKTQTASHIQPVSRGKELPLSFAQQRLWFLCQLEGSAVYNMHAAIELKGCLNIKSLELSINEIIARHEVLRTNFPVKGGEPIQSVTPSLVIKLLLNDLQDMAAEAQHNEIRRLALEEGQRPFDLAKDPLLRVTLIRLAKKSHVLLFTMHHIVSDGWSMGLFIRELTTIYEALSNGRACPLSPLTIQYADYAHWQQRCLTKETIDGLLDYWLQQLADAPEVLDIPGDRARPTVQTFRGKIEYFQLNAESVNGLRLLSRRTGTTLFMTLLAAFAALLYRYSGSNDIVIGSPIANRNRCEIEPLIGFFVNTLILRIDLSEDPTFTELLSRVREVSLNAYAHQDLPFEHLVEAVQPERSLSHSPLFQVMFVLQNAHTEKLELPGLSLNVLDREGVTSKFDLTLSMEETDKELIGEFEYNTDLFDQETIRRMISHFLSIVESVTANPDDKVRSLPMLKESELNQLTVEWNNTAIDYEPHICIPELFESHLDQCLDKTAVIFEEEQLTYKELNSRANQVACYLHTLGFGPDSLVGICMNRSIEMMVGVLGILKAGCAYVPLDPDYPGERLALMMEDSQVSIIITQKCLKESLPDTDIPLFFMDLDREALSQLSNANLKIVNQPENLAYIIYTSGSSGKPKGVAMTHKALSNLIQWQLNSLKGSVMTIQFSSLSFDVSFQEIFSTWCANGTLVLIPNDIRRDPMALNRILSEKGIQRLFLPFVALQQIGEALDRSKLVPELKEIITAGEQLKITPPVARLFERLNGCSLHNQYGPSETHVVTSFTSQQPVNRWPVLPPIGRPIGNARIYIMDTYLQPVPINVAGELYIGGSALARGYYGRPDLTGEMFVPDPFGSAEGDRLYRTGDLARYLSNGDIEFLGRVDSQVKIRGFRVEPGEIETLLSEYRDVDEAVVVVLEDEGAMNQLVACIVPSRPSDPIEDELREYLKKRLPDYMIPHAFIVLEKIPLTPSGKIDRLSLPVSLDIPTKPGDDSLQPRTPVEEILCGIWRKVLGTEQVGVYDNFFSIGGHSLLATRVIYSIFDAFSVELPVSSIFESPTVAELSRCIEANNGKGRPTKRLVPISRTNDISLSFGQQRLWFLVQLEGQSATYNMPAALHLEGELHHTALERSMEILIKRHDSLRMCFPEVDGQAAAKILDVYNPLTITDLSGLSDAEQQSQKQALIKSHAQTPFDITTGPLLRLHLVKLSDEEHILLFNMHHIISDGWSIGVLIREWSALYSAYYRDQEAELPELSIRYTDYAAWQRAWFSGEVLEQQMTYWEKKLSGVPELLELPTYYPRPAVMSYRGAHLQSTIPMELTKSLKHLSREQGVTLYMTLLTAFNALLYRYSGQEDILVGSPIANRTNRQTEELIGFFVNTLMLRTRVQPEQPMTELLKQVRQTALEAYAHQDIPFEYLVEQLNPTRSLSHSPLFQVMFVLQNAPMVELDLADIKVSFLEQENTTTKFDLTLSIADQGDELVCDWEYCTDLFRPETIERMAKHFEILLEGMVTNPSQSVSQLPLLTETETQQLQSWNQTEADYPKEKTVVALFEEQVEKTPDNIAVVFDGQQLTYRELNRKANQLAHYLLSLKTETDNSSPITGNCLVGICVERSLEMVIGLLGILKAGAAYVPLDPDYPEHRLQFILEDSQVSVLLTQSHLRGKLSAQRAKVVCLDSEWENNANYSAENPTWQSEPEHLAYVIYTSGSTGKPKGVMVEHRNVLAMLYGYEQVAPVRYPLRGISVCPFSFDLSVWEFFINLCFGGTLHLVDLELLIHPKNFEDYLFNQQINCAYVPPSLLVQVVNELETRSFEVTLQRLLIGVEPIKQGLMQRYRDLSPKLNIINGYGPTETTICATFYPFIQVDKSERHIPIGKPVQGYQIYVVDSSLQPCPIGIPGELCIAGAGLARGYLNRPDLTEERFIDVEIFGKYMRLYKTGDRACWLPDGNLEYLGRLDNQIKLRGFRIELGEIEATLRQHEAVQEAVVVLHDNDDDKLLAAYVSMNNEQLRVYRSEALLTDNRTLITELRSWLKDQLPEYMVPSGFTVLDTMPLTPNGKIDRIKLQKLDIGYRGSEESYVAPRTPEEELLSIIWTNVLSVERVGIHDNFFELGGHSLLATQLVSRIREKFEVEMPLRIIFEHPILQDQAEWLDTRKRQSELPLIISLPENESPVLSFAQQRLWFLAQLEGQSATYNIPAALHLKGELDHAALEMSMETMIKRHDSLRMCFPEVDGQATVKILDVYNPVTFTDLSGLSETEQQRRADELIEKHAQAPFEVTMGPLLRLHLLKISDEEYILLFNMHHIISDGWSIGVLIREWSALYSAYYRDQEAELPELSVQYTDYAAWQRNWLSGEVLERQLAYWQEKLADAPELSEFPTDYQRPAVMSYRGEHLQSTIPEELTKSLKLLCREEGVTLYMTLLTAFMGLLYRYSRQEDILVGSPIANRTHHQTEDIIGFFVNTLVLRTRVHPEQPLSELLKQVRQTALEAYSHQDIPFEYLVERLNPTRSLSHSPLFQVMFVLQNAPMGELDLADLKVSLLEQESTIAKFDVTLSIMENEGMLICDWEYCVDLFRPETIARMTKHFQILLDGVANNPEQPVSRLPLLTETETRQLQVWNQTETDYPKEKTIVDLFQEQVEKTPDNIAVVFEKQQLTYRELNRKANQLAHYLLNLKSETDNSPLITGNCLVGICVERSLEMVIGLLGILKAGGAYVPLDPEYPVQRLAFMIKDSGIRILITQSELQTRLHSIVPSTGVPSYGAGNHELIIVNIEAVLTSYSPIVNLQSSIVNPQDLAYVMYTSGSTGVPKGVIVPHAAVVNLVKNTDYIQIDKNDCIAQASNISFDAATFEVWGSLLNGAQLVSLSKEVTLSSHKLTQHLCKHSINTLLLTTALFNQIAQTQPECFGTLKTLLFGGEQVNPYWVRTILDNIPPKSLLHMYGPTESTTFASFYLVNDGNVHPDMHTIPIGTPIANTQIYILDTFNNVTPIGIPGELCIAGAGLASGYLNRPDLTVEKFLEVEVFGKSERLYKTGDMARCLPDGNLEFLGRLDNQIKLRGFRIELGEIEAALSQHGAIKEAVVVLFDKENNPRLAAYVTTGNGKQSAMNNDGSPHTSSRIDNDSLTTELRIWLKSRIPEYMIPAIFTVLETLPLTPNGKIDRKALPKPGLDIQAEQVAPRTETERLLVDHWSQILGVEVTSVNDDFFMLGGHSLLAMRVISYIRETFELELPIQILFEGPTISSLSRRIEIALMQTPDEHISFSEDSDAYLEGEL